MPVLLRGTGAGSRQPPTGIHRPPSQVSNELLRAPGTNTTRRVSQLSATPSHATVQQQNSAGIRRTVSAAPPELTWKTRCRAAIKRFHLKRLFPLFFIMIYMLIGSLLFYWMESGNDEEVARNNNYVYERERELLRRRLEEILSDRAATKRPARRKFIDEAVDYYQQQIGYQVKNETQWDLMSSMYFAGTLFTTIGYGDISCVTTAGRIMTVIYSCVGIPLMLITLNDLGKFLYNNINGCVKSIDTAYLGVLRICSPAKKTAQADELDMVERGGDPSVDVSSLASQIGSEHSDFEDEGDKPPRMSVKVALGITIGWILLCAQLFRLWEVWSYGESLYFMYISCSTIGLGDISVQRRDMMVLCFVFVIVGLSLVSMSINVVQVALEDFYIQMMMKLIMEYQEKLAAGGDQMGASVGMMRMWGNNKTAKMLMPLLSKEKKRMAMDSVEKEAKSKGIEIPPILTDLDEKTGMPKLFSIPENDESEEGIPSMQLEEMVQKQILLEETAFVPMYMAHDADTQTESVISGEKSEQTEMVVVEEEGTMTEEEKREGETEETQTDGVEARDTEAQTARVEMMDQDTTTVGPSCAETEAQTEQSLTIEQEVQTYVAPVVDAQSGTELETKNIRIQTPCPIIEQKTIQTEDTEERKSPSKMSSARKRLRRAFAKPKQHHSLDQSPAMSDWKEVEEDSNLSDMEEVDDEGSVESLHWNPVDGMHAEKQLPVSRLTAMFDRPARKGSEGARKFSSFKKQRESSRTRRTSE